MSLVGLAFTVNAYRPRQAPAWLALASFFAGWLTGELALHHLLWQGLVVGAFVYVGALAAWPGKLGLAVSLVSWALLWRSWRGGDAAATVMAAALDDALPDLDDAPPLDDEVPPRWRQLAFPIPVQHPAVERLRNLPYFSDGKLQLWLDIVRRRGDDFGPEARRPALIYVHGGGWILGQKEYQGLPLMQRLAAHGWVCFSIDYRLSPRATFPDHVVDVKRAIAWVRAHAREHGVDPACLVLAGNSAGGHLASLAALTPHRRELQPGFEDADTSVAACLSFYGIYDFTDRHRHWPHAGLTQLLERYVMKTRLADAHDAFAAASPLTWVGEHAPPFLVVHGERDSMVTVAEARAFSRALQAVSHAPCVYVEVPGAQHAFEIFPSPRTLHVLDGVERFLGWVRRGDS
jgi:acetyl esterase/lipase